MRRIRTPRDRTRRRMPRPGRIPMRGTTRPPTATRWSQRHRPARRVSKVRIPVDRARRPHPRRRASLRMRSELNPQSLMRVRRRRDVATHKPTRARRKRRRRAPLIRSTDEGLPVAGAPATDTQPGIARGDHRRIRLAVGREAHHQLRLAERQSLVHVGVPGMPGGIA
jgi:hypothetical protein